MVFLLLALNIFYTFFRYFNCWLWTSKVPAGKKQIDRDIYSQYSYICVAQLDINTDKYCCIRAFKMTNVHQMKKNSLIFAPKSLLVASFPGKTQGCLISGMVMQKKESLLIFFGPRDLFNKAIYLNPKFEKSSNTFQKNISK